MSELNPNFKSFSFNFLGRLRIEAEKVCTNNPTRSSASDKSSEWRSYIHTWDSKTKIWEDICWRVKYPDANGKSLLVLGAFSNKGNPENFTVFQKIENEINSFIKPEWINLRNEGVSVTVEVDATDSDEEISKRFAEIQNIFISLIPIFIRNMHGKIAKINSLIRIDEQLDFVSNWDENTNQVLVVAGNWGRQIAKKYSIYECQNERSFRSSKYLAFYDDGKIQEVFEIIGKPYDNATSSNTQEILKMSLDIPNYNGIVPRRCFKLKSLGEVGPIINDSKGKSGKTVPFTYGQSRYTNIDLIRKAKTTSELIHGLRPNLITDSFVSNRKRVSPKIDILWVIDNSGSMASYQTSLGKNFQSFINNFINKPEIEIPDFKMAITTTDESDNGLLRGEDVLCKDWAMDDELNEMFINFFELFVAVGTSGSATERGLKCSWLSVKNNSSFFRSDAPLVINIVTDEEDDDSTDVNFYLDEIASLRLGQRVIINLIGLPGFKRYEQAVYKSKGIYLDIKSDFSTVLESISQQMVEVSQSYALSQLPVNPSNIKFIVNGIESEDFSYNSITNTLKLGNSVSDGATVEVEYEIEDN